MKNLYFVLAVFGVALLGGEQQAQAVETTTITSTAMVEGTCSVSAPDMDFGSYAEAELKSTTTLTASCSAGTNYAVHLSEGVGAPAADAFAANGRRRMMNQAETSAPGLEYNLFFSANTSCSGSIWGNGTENSAVENRTGTGADQSIVVNGCIFANQTLRAGTYMDTIQVSLNL